MKIKYDDILEKYKLLYQEQPDEVKRTICLGEFCKEDPAIQEVLQSISQIEVQYKSYTHN